ncbi:MAG TPA: hypothetical protein VFM18_11855 [Methanosarcina sp.]|nr:hypothetical protein [Methanosarcina sp.]
MKAQNKGVYNLNPSSAVMKTNGIKARMAVTKPKKKLNKRKTK